MNQAQFVPPVFMCYIEEPKIDWTVNNGLYHRFLKWKLKCENILDCELSMLPESCPWKIFAFMQYGPSVKSFASHRWMKSEPNLTCLQASDKETNQLMSGTMLYKHKCLLPSTHQKLQVSCIQTYSCSSWKMKILVPNTINECSVDLQKFLASKFWQLAKKTESSKATAHHIKQVQVTTKQPKSIWWDIRGQTSHQARTRRKLKFSSQDNKPTRCIQVNTVNKCHHTRKQFDPQEAHKRKDRCSKCGDSKHVEGFKCPVKKFQGKTCNMYGHFTSLCIRCILDRCIGKKIPYVASQVIWLAVMNLSVYKWRYNAHKLILRFLHHIILLPM